MALNFLDTVKNYFSDEFCHQAANSLDESGSGVSKALSAIIPIGLAGILSKATSGNDGANSVFNMAKNAAGYFSPSPNLSDLHNDERGSDIPSGVFGNHQSQVESAISRFAGIKNSSVSSLMTLAMPAIMGFLGKHTEQNNLSASGLSGFLSSQKDTITNAMPSGLSSLAGMLGLGSLGAAASGLKSSMVDSVDTVVERKGGGAKWLLPLILILAAFALLWYFSTTWNKKTKVITSTATDSTAIAPPADTSKASASTGVESIKVKLPNGKELDANKGGIEDQLVTFLNGDWKSMSDSALKAKWFDFDNLNFDLGKATLLQSSEKQLDNLAEILKAFPDAKLKIGGYTDASGNAESNKKLSQARADAAKAGLDKRGVGKQIIDATGYGSQFAKAAATAPDSERALDRHVSVSVRK